MTAVNSRKTCVLIGGLGIGKAVKHVPEFGFFLRCFTFLDMVVWVMIRAHSARVNSISVLQ